jgi:hypothetical protein
LLRDADGRVNKKRVERTWLQEGLKVPQQQPERGQLWVNDGSSIRLEPEHPNHAWSYDFVADRTHNERKIRMLNIVNEFTREALATFGTQMVITKFCPTVKPNSALQTVASSSTETKLPPADDSAVRKNTN